MGFNKDVQVAEQEKLAQEKRNALNVAKAVAEREAAQEFAKAKDSAVAKTELQIRLTMAQKWDGSVPANVVPSNSPFLFSFQK